MGDLGFEHVWQPAAAGAGGRALLLLHGTGGDERDLLPLAATIAPGAAVLSPRGKVLEGGMPRWFRRLAPGVFDEADLRERAAELNGFVIEAGRHYGFDPSAITAVGFSNGANIAAAMMLMGCDVPHHAVLIRAMVPLVPPRAADLSGRRALIVAGRFDPMAPQDQPKKLLAMLRAAGAGADLHFSDAGHELVQTDVDAAAAFLATG